MNSFTLSIDSFTLSIDLGFACSFYLLICVSVIHENILMVFVPSWYICHIHTYCVSSAVKLNKKYVGKDKKCHVVNETS